MIKSVYSAGLEVVYKLVRKATVEHLAKGRDGISMNATSVKPQSHRGEFHG